MRLKHRVLPFSLVLFVALAPAFSQGIRVGVKGGIGYSTFMGKDFSDSLTDDSYERKFFLPFSGGVFATIGLVDIFAVQPEVLFLHLGGKFGDDTETETIKTSYLAPAVLAKARFGILNVFVGPSVLIKVSNGTGTLESGGSSVDSDLDADALTNALFAAVAGAGVEYTLGPGSLVMEVRGMYSFTSSMNEDAMGSGSDPKLFSVMAMVGYSIPIGK